MIFGCCLRQFMRLSRDSKMPFTYLLSLHSTRRLHSSSLLCCQAKSDNKLNLDEKSKGKFFEESVGGYSIINSRTISGFILLGGFVYAIFYYIKRSKELEKDRKQTQSMGRAAIGGEFELVDTMGKSVTSQDLLGQWLLIYFGFTRCPDICPEELEKMSKAVDLLAASKRHIQPVFITVDPTRDDPKTVGTYVKEFHPQLLGLTGSVEQIKKACHAYRVYFSEGPKDFENDYIVDHTIIMYLVDPDGEFVTYYGQNRSTEEMFSDIMLHMAKHSKDRKSKR